MFCTHSPFMTYLSLKSAGYPGGEILALFKSENRDLSVVPTERLKNETEKVYFS